MVFFDTWPTTKPYLDGNSDPDSSEVLFEALREHLLAFEGFAKTLQLLENKASKMQDMCKQTSLSDLMKKHGNTDDIIVQVKQQIRILEGHQESMNRTYKLAMESMAEIRRISPRMRASLDRETTNIIRDVYKMLHSTSHWSGRVIAQRDHGLIPPQGQRLDVVVKDLSFILAFRALPLDQERYCFSSLEASQKKLDQIKVLQELERVLATASTHRSAQALCRDGQKMEHFVEELLDPNEKSLSDMRSEATDTGSIQLDVSSAESHGEQVWSGREHCAYRRHACPNLFRNQVESNQSASEILLDHYESEETSHAQTDGHDSEGTSPAQTHAEASEEAGIFDSVPLATFRFDTSGFL